MFNTLLYYFPSGREEQLNGHGGTRVDFTKGAALVIFGWGEDAAPADWPTPIGIVPSLYTTLNLLLRHPDNLEAGLQAIRQEHGKEAVVLPGEAGGS